MEKLVRDRIPAIIRAAGGEPRFRRATEGERLGLLVRKLQEEATELQRTPCLDECADVLEVVLAIAEELHASSVELYATAAAKVADRGAFREGYVLELAGESM